MTRPLNKKGRPFSWSYSALNAFETCPHQYAAERFFFTAKQEENEASIWGGRVHKALELRGKEGTPLPEGMKQWEKWAALLDRTPGKSHCELQLALSEDLRPSDWFGREAWGRAVIDRLILDGKKALILDWKTGKLKDDPTQVAISAWFVSQLYPEVKEFNCRFVWLKSDHATGQVLKKDELPAAWEGFRHRIDRMEEAWRTQEFPCNPSGLCRGWCSVKDCVHWKEKRR